MPDTLAILLGETSWQHRFWLKVKKQSFGCWEWSGSLSHGYGQFEVRASGSRKNLKAHRVSYLLANGSIPSDLPLDHLCRNRACVNPSHLEPVTHQVNIARGEAGQYMRAKMAAKTHCKNGHPYTAENVYLYRKTGHRQCKVCAVERTRVWRAAQRNLEKAA